MDSRLLPFVLARDEMQAEAALAALLEQHALPIIARIAGNGREAEDLRRAILAKVIGLLRECKAAPAAKPIANFSHCVAVLAQNICRAEQRRPQPRRRNLKDALRHRLTHDLQFALWLTRDHTAVCGLLHWLDTPPRASDRLQQLRAQPHILNEVIGGEAQRLSHGELLRALFRWVGHPVLFDDLVAIVAALQRDDDLLKSISSDVRPETAERAFLEQLWCEIEQLPPLQRRAYLLHGTDGDIELFWVYGIVSLRHIGNVLQLTNEQFQRAWVLLEWNDTQREQARALTSYEEKFAMLWQQLPLNDLVLAALLETTPQNVLALREAARSRLSQKMADF